MKFGLLAAMVLLTGCGTSPKANESATIANPASEHCVKLGGKVEMRTEASGQVGYCRLPDGRVVEEWALFRDSK
mgnify:CR=1 FL=1